MASTEQLDAVVDRAHAAYLGTGGRASWCDCIGFAARASDVAPIVDASGDVIGVVGWDHERGLPLDAVEPMGMVP